MYNSDGLITISQMRPRDLEHLVRTGEGKFLEFKRTTPEAGKIAREISAFANTRGGTILIGVNDDLSISGVQGYFEEEYLLRKAAREICLPAVSIDIELVHYDELDVLVIRVPESKAKPVYTVTKKEKHVFIRRGDESVLATETMVEVLKSETSGEGVTFEYGEREQKLFRYLNEYGEITIEKFSHLVSVSGKNSTQILVNLVSAGILRHSIRDSIDYFSFSERNQ